MRKIIKKIFSIVILTAMIITISVALVPFAADDHISTEDMNLTGEILFDASGDEIINEYYYIGTDGALYLMYLDTKSSVLVYDDTTLSERWTTGGITYCISDGNSIIGIDHSAYQAIPVYTHTADIEHLHVDENMIFFNSGNTIYKIDRNTNTTSAIFSGEDLTEFVPLSNHSIIVTQEAVLPTDLTQYNSGKTAVTSITREINILTNTYTVIPQSDVEVGDHVISDISPKGGYVSSMTINGHVIPMTNVNLNSHNVVSYNSNNTIIDNTRDFTEGSYFTTTGGDCGSHSYCLKYDGASQCMGFAKLVYDYIWGSNKTIYYPNYTFSGSDAEKTTALKIFLDGLPTGSFFEVSRSTSTNPHSMVYLGYTDTALKLYQANYDCIDDDISTHCEVHYCSRTLSGIWSHSYWTAIIRVFVPYHTHIYTASNSAHTCIICKTSGTHILSSIYHTDHASHWKVCGACGYKANMGIHTYSNGYCTVCGVSE